MSRFRWSLVFLCTATTATTAASAAEPTDNKGSSSRTAGAGDAPASGQAAKSASPADGAAPADKDDPSRTRVVGGYSYSDKKPTGTWHRPAAVHNAPRAHFPAFELANGGSRLTLHLSQTVPVEEKRGAGTVTYVLRGAHVARWNDTNALVAVHFNTPLSVARLRNTGKDAELRVDLRAAVTPTFQVTPSKDPKGGATLTIDFPGGDYLPQDGRDPAEYRGSERRAGTPMPNTPPAPPAPAPAPAPAGPKGPTP